MERFKDIDEIIFEYDLDDNHLSDRLHRAILEKDDDAVRYIKSYLDRLASLIPNYSTMNKAFDTMNQETAYEILKRFDLV
mgnify:CR=1 FL=1|tara:strand:+ start:20 stop:259 length:240 start_codon:yes stop_codon:yes gene_type:complete